MRWVGPLGVWERMECLSSLPRSPALVSYAGEREGAVCCPISLADLLGKGRTILSASGIPRNEKRTAYPFNWFLSDAPLWAQGCWDLRRQCGGGMELWSFAGRKGKV